MRLRATFSMIAVAALLAGLAEQVCFAKTVQLFSQVNGESIPIAGYSWEVANIEPGDILVFSNGKKFTVIGKPLGKGGTTVIFSALHPDGREVALRIPNSAGGMGRMGARNYINATFLGYEILRMAGVPAVELHEWLTREYVVVDKIEVEMSLYAFWSKPPADEAKRNRMVQELLEFCKTLAPFRRIGDFRSGQVVYDGKNRRWILLDWLEHHTKLKRAENPQTQIHPFTDDFKMMGLKRQMGQWTPDKRATDWQAWLANQIEFSIIQSRPSILQNKRVKCLERMLSLLIPIPG